MYGDIIAHYFVTCLINKLHHSSNTEYSKHLYIFKKIFKEKDQRRRIYEEQLFQLLQDYYPNITFKVFLKECIENFYTEFEFDKNNYYLLFDKTITNAVLDWINYLLCYEVDNIILNGKNPKYFAESKEKFLYYLFINIRHLSMGFNDKEMDYSKRHYKQLIEYIKFLKETKANTVNASTQTDEII